jgi:rhodanese-related sulfurtransferase
MTFNFGAVLAVFLAGSAAPGDSGSATPAAIQAMVPVIAPAAVKALIASSAKFVLVDVRQPEEFAAGHIDGALLVPLGTIETAYRSLPKDTKLVVYCRAGHRSAKAVAFLQAHGYTHAVSLDGGYLAWSALPL